MGWSYRVGQFWRAVAGSGAALELGELGGLLSTEQQALFRTMSAVDQRHCVAVARSLTSHGYQQPDLLLAALFHDVGKSLATISVWERVAHVLLLRFAPGLVARLGSEQPGGLAHGLYVLAHHSDWGADLAERAGLPAGAVALMRGAGDAQMLAALRQADDRH